MTRQVIGVTAALALGMACWIEAQSADARQQLMRSLDGIARLRIEERALAIGRVRTRADADRRKALVRDKVRLLIGGLPSHQGAPSVKAFGSVTGEGFRVENVAYESLPGFWVTANVYVPASGSGPFPAVVVAPGHGAAGKTENWSWGVNLARNGIVVLAYDPIGQGERLQYFDPARGASIIGNPTGEHGEANVGPLLIGDTVARYMVNDAMRGVDYLISRKDVDGARIGAFGCSGGGTTTAYLAALDDRVKAAASACYITSFTELLASPTGAQEAEQTLPHFVQEGLDFADWVEASAPKPYAIVSTTDDMFPFEGARRTYEEARRIYALYGAGDRLQWITGPGGHGNLGPISPAILTFFTTSLAGSTAPPTFTPMRLERPADLQCTPTGQVATSLGGETIYSLNRTRAESLMAKPAAIARAADIQSLQTRLRQEIRRLTGATVQPGASPGVVNVKASEPRDGYRIDTIEMTSDAGLVVSGLVATPERAGAKPAVLMLDTQPKEALAAQGGEIDRLARLGYVVLVLDSRPTPPGTESIKSPYLGIYNLLNLRAFLVGKSLIGLRTDDAIRAMDWLSSRPDVDRSATIAYGSGALGMVVLHAAVLDSRIGRVVIEHTLASYRMIVDQPIHRNVSDVVVPGVLRHYDTGDLLLAVHPRPVTILSPRDALGEDISDEAFRRTLPQVFLGDEHLGSAGRVRLASRKPGDPLPIGGR